MRSGLLDSRGRPRVVVTGLGLLTPCGVGLDASWAALVSGRSGIGPITQFDAAAFDTRFAGEVKGFDPSRWMDGKEIRRNDRFIQFSIAAAEMAMADAAYKVAPGEGERVAVIVGAGLGGLGTLEKNHSILLERGPGKISPFFIPAMIVNLAPGQLSIRFGAKGPNWSPVSACATSAHAVGEAVELIRRGGADAVIAGGSEATITPLGVGGFNAMRALSTRNEAPEEASRPWDKDRDGFVMGEGAGILVLESLEHALRRGARVRAELTGYGATADAYHITAPDGDGARRAMAGALKDAGIDPSAVQYINAHGTSTPVGDEKEVEAVKAVFGPHAKSLLMSSTKSMHGHLLGAAGSVEAIICAKAIEERLVPPTINLDSPSESCDLDFVAHTARSIDLEVVMSNSFGFGGTNTTLVLARFGTER
ncbi:MAG: beta-ketoacyl-ACP synthase II [Deltaproteobacteria bacterium]|nr:beta-ketoacyl-ACP synthase II [Deltaproteobacteria bacterium]